MPYVKYPERELARAVERFRARLIMTDSGCIVWTGATDANGYGVVNSVYFPSILVHRVAWWLAGRELIPGMTLDHGCRNHRCANVDHLEQVTIAENVRRGESGRFNARKTHCPRGHEYSEANTVVRHRGRYVRRVCLTCSREQDRARKRAKRMRSTA